MLKQQTNLNTYHCQFLCGQWSLKQSLIVIDALVFCPLRNSVTGMTVQCDLHENSGSMEDTYTQGLLQHLANNWTSLNVCTKENNKMYLENISALSTHVTASHCLTNTLHHYPTCMLFDKLGQGPLKPSSYNIFLSTLIS